MKKLVIFISAILLICSVTAFADNNTGDEAKIKTVIKKSFIIHSKAKADVTECDGQIYQAKSNDDMFAELGEYVSNSHGLIDNLKEGLSHKAANEGMYNGSIKKNVYKNFDFKNIQIVGDEATVTVDVYWEVTNRMGAQTTVLMNPDNIGVKEVIDTPARDVVLKGVNNWTIVVDKTDNKWQIISEDTQY